MSDEKRDVFKHPKGSFDRLTEKNYSQWKGSIERLLRAEGLWNLTMDLHHRPPRPALNDEPAHAAARIEAIEKWDTLAANASALIYNACGTEVRIHIDGINDPVIMWETLRERCNQASSVMGRQTIYRKFMALRPESGVPISEYFKKLIELRNQLIGTEEHIPDIAFKTQLFSTLPSIFEVTAKIQQGRVGATITEVMDALKDDEEMRAMRVKTDAVSTEGLYSEAGHEKNWCNFCRRDTHLTKDCRSKGRKRKWSPPAEPNNSSPSKGPCWHCGEEGHFSRNCPIKKKARLAKEATSGRKNEAEANIAFTTLTSEALTASQPTQHSRLRAWAADSAASDTMCNDRRSFKPGSLTPCNYSIKLGDHHVVQAQEKGIVIIRNLELEALLVPEFRLSLLSIRQLDKLGYSSTFENGKCTISKDKKTVLIAPETQGLYLINMRGSALATTRSQSQEKNLNMDCNPAPGLNTGINKTRQSDSPGLWHRRMAHLGSEALKILLESTGQREDKTTDCDTCIKTKHQQRYTRTSATRSNTPFELIHSDLAGPFATSNGGAAHYIIYTDDCTRFTKVYFTVGKTAAEISAKFSHFKSWTETQGYKIKRFRCDNGTGEYSNQIFQDLLNSAGITYEPAPPYTQHKNGVAERMIRTLNMKARAMLLDANLPMKFWAEAVNTACYLHHRTPTASLLEFKTPYEMLYGSKAPINHLRRFGCTAYKFIPKEQRKNKKFGPRSRPCMLIGYVHKTTNIWRLWDFESGSRGKAIECSNVIFRETENAYENTGEDINDLEFPDSEETEEDPDVDRTPTDEIDMTTDEPIQEQVYVPVSDMRLDDTTYPARNAEGFSAKEQREPEKVDCVQDTSLTSEREHDQTGESDTQMTHL